MKYILKFIGLILICILTLTSVACDKTSEAYIYFELPDTPSSLDPQVAESDSELLIVRNIFEGLMRADKSGKIKCAAAKSYKKDGLNYTFKLRDDIVWSNGDKITADDFVFALKRAVNPETKAPFASRLFSIENAEDIHSGKMHPDHLGVTATDKTTLKITLCKEDKNFLETLTTSIAMPCNEEFFYSTDGKYGVTADDLLYNGSYKMSRWRKETFGIRLYKNENYKGKFEALNAAAFLTCQKDKDILELIEKESIDIAFVDSTLKNDVKNLNYSTKEFGNICWVLTIGQEFSSDMRKSFSLLVGSNIYKDSIPVGYSVATSIYPSAIENPSNSLFNKAYDPNGAKALYLKELEKLPDKKFPKGIKLYYYDNNAIKGVVTDIVGHFQSQLSAFVNIEAESNLNSLTSQLSENTYSFAFFPVKADSSFYKEYLQKFSVSNTDDLKLAEKEIMESYTTLPVMFQNTTIAYAKTLTEFSASQGNGYIDFAYIVKEK